MAERMTRTLNGIVLFTKVAELGSFTAAAKALGVPLPTVSRRVAELEADIGLRLFHRTTRRLSLTEVGDRYLEHGRRIVEELIAAGTEAANTKREPAGRLKLTAPVLFGRDQIAPIVADYLAAYPEVHCSFHLSDQTVDLVEQGYDLAIRGGELTNSAMIVRRIGHIVSGLYASPDFLARQGEKVEPGTLGRYPLIDVRADSLRRRSWMLSSGRDQREVIFTPRHEASDAEAAAQLAERGLGICQLPTFIGDRRCEAGRLTRVLPSFLAGEVPVSAIYPSQRGQTPAARALIDFIAARLAGQ